MAMPDHRGYNNNQIRNVRVIRQDEEAAPPGTTRRKHPITRNVTTTTPQVSQAGSAPSIDEQFSAGYGQSGIQKTNQTSPHANQKRIIDRSAQAEYSKRPIKSRPARSQRIRIQKKKRKPGSGKVALGRARATGVNMGIWSWGLFTWLVFQLPLAILSIAFLGVSIAVEAFIASGNITESDGIIEIATKTGTEMLVGLSGIVAGALDFLFGIDLSVLNPTAFFLMTYTVIIGYALFILLSIYLVYKISFLRPFSGQSAGLKKGMLLLALIGYSIPVLNLFPWFIPWTVAVWVRPK
ncbi:MAG: hypothetical protein ABW116_01535 [Candidatus Sedimenticola sp. 20ELBAFRAG]